GAEHRPAPIDVDVSRRAQDDQRRVLHPDAALAAHLDRGPVARLTGVRRTAVAGTDLAAAEAHAPTASQTAVDADLAAPTLEAQLRQAGRARRDLDADVCTVFRNDDDARHGVADGHFVGQGRRRQNGGRG